MTACQEFAGKTGAFMTFLGKLLGRSSLDDLQEVLSNLGFLADAEAQTAEFYRLCADAMPEEADMWNSLSAQEQVHSGNAMRMADRISNKPKDYKPGISFPTVQIRMFAVEMQRLVEQMRGGEIPRDRLFSMALEIEDSAIEISYEKIVKTEDPIFNMLARQNDHESSQHKAAIAERMNTWNAGVSHETLNAER